MTPTRIVLAGQEPAANPTVSDTQGLIAVNNLTLFGHEHYFYDLRDVLINGTIERTTDGASGAVGGSGKDELESSFGFNGAPWCAIFATTAAVQGGASRQVRAAVSQVRQWASEGSHGYVRGFRTDPRPGDLMAFGTAHVGMVEASRQAHGSERAHLPRVRYRPRRPPPAGPLLLGRLPRGSLPAASAALRAGGRRVDEPGRASREPKKPHRPSATCLTRVALSLRRTLSDAPEASAC